MSGESFQHVSLVERLIDVIGARHKTVGSFLMLADHHSYGADRPPKIGGYTPDVFASDLPETFHVLGEAKTPEDLESDRSARQIAAFLEHLSLRPSSQFYLAVPWICLPRAQGIIRSLQYVPRYEIQFHFITDIPRG
ncbi:hypothetical protein [Hyphomicrobium sp. NDB2Meth4]|uniref:hypothetical protein n=1 Tax=Hyphomicrobium sp. NDB2Meth4 TaxID=1892846 RepID=UPI000930C040|nr:hypothetical protein [Hyphomicrobium sp. NDB2Meth4]